MPLDLSEERKEHLAFLPQVDSTVVSEFGRIVVEFPRLNQRDSSFQGHLGPHDCPKQGPGGLQSERIAEA
ncbi:hypothetical protein E2I00_007514 [Balaenoptera physalus]|uniref:Uncharacterized protein n=1 Tax=Balaenoptera physalus TaxID=9770 RepID=A0A643C2S8_BALPH|nr:hypothetical protein E2I00_007514 [Balaenoptera physalus]